MKNFCEKHHFNFNGARCPFCEKDRITEMAAKFVPKNKCKSETKNTEQYKNCNTDASWEDLQDKFNIIKKK